MGITLSYPCNFSLHPSKHANHFLNWDAEFSFPHRSVFPATPHSVSTEFKVHVCWRLAVNRLPFHHTIPIADL